VLFGDIVIGPIDLGRDECQAFLDIGSGRRLRLGRARRDGLASKQQKASKKRSRFEPAH